MPRLESAHDEKEPELGTQKIPPLFYHIDPVLVLIRIIPSSLLFRPNPNSKENFPFFDPSPSLGSNPK